MIPAKIEDVFIQVTTNYTGVVTGIVAGKFSKSAFRINESIYDSCPFLEGTLDALPLKESFLLEGMVITAVSNEYNIDLELFKNDTTVTILIHNRTNVYKYVDQLNQNRNDIFLIKRELAEKNIELDKLRKIADKANEEKSRFLAMMSHEIRNPLNSILGYAEMISAEKLNKKVTGYLKNLSASGKNLKVIVDDILDLSRIEAGKLTLILEEVSIHEIIDNCKNDFQYLNTNEEVALSFITSANIPKVVLGDSVRIQQILVNLISNAIKFTNKGSVVTRVQVISDAEKEIKLIFEITDSGRGMSEVQCLKIFEEYQQNELNDHRVHGGAGLGLAIVNRLVNAMDGKISVKSELNVGTSFFVEIPFNKTTKLLEPLNIEVVKNENISLKGKNILVADDDVMNQTIVAHILKKEKVNLTLVSDGLEALSEIKKKVFDVVLLDINMPNMTGEEVMKQKVTSINNINLKTPFIALTANASSDDLVRYLQLGFSSVISKPYTIVDFIEKIKASL